MILFFLVHLTAQITASTGTNASDELGRIWKEAVVAPF
jgi:hypothetical protein